MKRELLRMNHVSLLQNGESLLDNLNFQMFAGEIMGLVAGRNRGYDQLIQLICQNLPISFGTVWYDGQIVNTYSHSSGTFNRVYVIEQMSHLVEGLSVVDNLFVLRKGFKKYFINERVLREQANKFFGENGLKVNVNKRVSALTPLERCLIELGKALLMGCKLIIIDNPGNFLSQYELMQFQDMLRLVQKNGVSILYIGNHHQEVFLIADRTSLFFDGRIIKVFERNEMTDKGISPYITDWYLPGSQTNPEQEDGVLHFHSVHGKNLHGLRFVLHRAECLTILDMDNRIAEDILSLMTGTGICFQGRITLDHEPYTPERAADYLKAGIAVIPKDCSKSLLFHERSYMENLTFLLDRKLQQSFIPEKIYRSIKNEFGPLVGDFIEESIVTHLPLEEQIALVYYRILLFHPRVLICIQPLANGDMIVRLRILALLQEILKTGTAILIITTNVSDTLMISDRLLIVENGTCVASYNKNEFDQVDW